MEYRRRTKYPGVYERTSTTRMHKGRPDICFDITYRADGRKVWEKAGWASEGYSAKLASDIRSERTRSVRHGKELPRNRKSQPKFTEVAEKYLKWAEANKKSHDDDSTRYRLHIAPRLDKKRLNEISSFDLERMKSELLKGGLSPATTKHVLVLIRQIYNKAIAWGLYSGGNPVKGVKLPVLQNGRERFLSYSEAEALLDALKPDIRDMALLALYTGMRAGEIFGLRVHDIDLRHGFITILDAKNNQSRRAYMTGAVLEMMKRRVVNLEPDDLVFTDKHGKPLKDVPYPYRTVTNRLFNKDVKDPRQRVTFHTLRHTFASWLALQGESLLTIKELLGHKTLAMVMRYAHLLPDHKKVATLKLEQSFNGKGQEVEAV